MNKTNFGQIEFKRRISIQDLKLN